MNLPYRRLAKSLFKATLFHIGTRVKAGGGRSGMFLHPEFWYSLSPGTGEV